MRDRDNANDRDHIRAHFGEPAWTIPFTKQEPHLHLFVIERPRGISETLVITCGMSELPMTVPDHVEDKSLQHAELAYSCHHRGRPSRRAWMI